MKIAFDGRKAAAAYSQAFQRLKALPGFDHKSVLRAEAGVILKTWAGRTKVTTKDKAERRMRSGIAWKMGIQSGGGSNPYGVTVNDGSRGGFRGEVWFRTAKKRFSQAGKITPAGSFVPAWKHFKSADWQKINTAGTTYAAMLRERRPKVQRSIGLNRQAVVKIADDLGIDLSAVKGGGTLSGAGIAKARAAIASNGNAYNNGSGYQGGDNVKAYVELICRLPYGTKIGMDRTLASILASRAKYIERSYQKGAFDSMKNTARAFPNLLDMSRLQLAA